MSAEQGRSIERTVLEVVSTVFGESVDKLSMTTALASDLMAESLDYVDIELHLSQRLGLPFRFDQLRPPGEEGRGPLRLQEIVDYLEGLAHPEQPRQ